MAGYLTKNGHELGNKTHDSIGSLLDQPETIRSICRTHSGQGHLILPIGLALAGKTLKSYGFY